MVSVSRETPEAIDERLGRVIAAAELVELAGEWSFHESPLDQPPVLHPDMLAVVRDDDCWSSLTASNADSDERFAVFSFHFAEGLDNSGFVGWLATKLKHGLGTGVLVVCGQNSARGGIYDYWGCPVHLRAEARQLIEDLRGRAWRVD